MAFVLAYLVMATAVAVSVMSVDPPPQRDQAFEMVSFTDQDHSPLVFPCHFTDGDPDKVPIQGQRLTVLRFYDDYQDQITSTATPVLISADAEIPNPGDIVGGIRDSKSWTDLLGVEAMIYTFLITLGGWFSAFIPGLKNIDSGVFRVLTWAVPVIGGGIAIGFGNVWAGAISYFFSTSLYEVVLKWIKPSPKPRPA